MSKDVLSVSGNWETSPYWSLGFAPMASDDAFIGAELSTPNGPIWPPVKVTSANNVTVNSIGVAPNCTLIVTGNRIFTATNGTTLSPGDTAPPWGIGNLGSIDVDPGSILDIGGAFDNVGSLILGAPGVLRAADLRLIGNATLYGGGVVKLEAVGSEITSDGPAPATFSNEVTILATASGRIGDAGVYTGGANDLTFNNFGVTEAMGSGVTLTLNTGARKIGDSGGTIEAANYATVRIDSNVATGSYYVPGSGVTPPPGGTIEAAAHGEVDIAGSIESGLVNVPGSVGVTGQVAVESGGYAVIHPGGSVAIPVDIYGVSGAYAGGVVTLEAGGSITGPVVFESPGATINVFSNSVDVFGNQGSVYLSRSSVNINGEDDAINFLGRGDSATIAGTHGLWDTVTGSDGSISVLNAQTWAYGGGNTIEFEGGGADCVGIYDTNGADDTISGTQGWVGLNSSSAALDANHSVVIFTGVNSLTSNGNSETFDFGTNIGVTSIKGFEWGDVVEFTTADFANFSDMMNHTSQVGANTVISLSGVDAVTLDNVAMSSLAASEFTYKLVG